MSLFRLPVLFFVAATTYSACGKTNDQVGVGSVQETKNLCAAAAELFAKGEMEKSVNVLAPHWPLAGEELRALAYQTKSQLGMVQSRFGAALGVEFIRSVEAGGSFAGHVFAVKYENHAIRLICRFYKPKDRWIVNSFTWDDQPMVSFGG